MKTTALSLVLSVLLLAGCDADDDAPAPATPTSTAVSTATASALATATATEAPSTITPTRTITPTPTITLTPSLTPTLGLGANITFMGVLRADNTLLEPSGFDDEGRPIYRRPQGSGFVVVVEARPGTSRRPVGSSTFDDDPEDPSLVPDLQILTSRPLGDGSEAVCDDREPNFGGVPATDPPVFDGSQEVANALNDLACRFVDGQGDYRGRQRDEACILFSDGLYDFSGTQTTMQFCAAIPVPLAFPAGDTVLTARVRDNGGDAGPPAQIVIHVGA